MAISIKILQTGSIRSRPSHRHQPANKAVLLRRLSVLLDTSWTDPLPINTYLIDHPEGPILFDSGESPHSMEPGYFPLWMPFFHLAVDIDVGKDEGIGSRLEQENLTPGDLKAVVLSHLHHDHGDGLPDLVGAPVWITEEHWQAYKTPFYATMEGAVPNQWPASFKPSILQPTGGLNGPWNQSYPITEDGKVVAVDTPGHVPGYLSVIVRADDVSYLLLGDATYDQDLLDQELTDGVNSNPALAVDSLRKIKEFARSENVVLLPAHDPQAAHRLTEKVIYRPNAVESPLNQGSLYTTPGLLLVLFGTVVFLWLRLRRGH
ncbi:metallo-beta-lactamase superfamily protein [Colletotrichum costaricense]|uniref:Metallo-beta-lactamase superfamily protein n=2 Tax=Colletotrichum acutatum species complex TaxID=2707335 RepID=A0AAJ0E5Y0_9PEZI|nr:metallo-beta-lactamase superfamily protein [Colletotrichum costaricense]KAK1534878.1 metallo-beta-lactamase superfamily protein [Colletotrichum costaricense]